MTLVESSKAQWHPELSWKTRNLRLNPFESCCYGVVTVEPYMLYLEYLDVNVLMALMSLISIILFLNADHISRSTTVHYTTAVSVGISFSLLILVFILQRKLKQSIFSWFFILYATSVYVMQSTVMNIYQFSSTAGPWILGYCCVTGVLSWAAVYRIGFPSHPRTLSLIQWSLQGFSLFMLAFSSYYTFASVNAACLLLLQSFRPQDHLLKYMPTLGKQFRKTKVCLAVI